MVWCCAAGHAPGLTLRRCLISYWRDTRVHSCLWFATVKQFSPGGAREDSALRSAAPL